nr:PREDICTED: papilin [Anolis carolinensis]|eukprot:XP_016853594.1 PREDICTED: papilin [Anolis carolinensis]
MNLLLFLPGLLKPGDCPRRRLPGLPRPTQAYCIEGGPCPGEEQCCPIGNIRKCVLPVGVHPGFCPRRDDATVFTKHCSWDLDCTLDEKCCPSEGQRRCTKALPANPGLCPKKRLSRVSSPCEGKCRDDQACPKGQKCCFVDCGLKCVRPESHHSRERVELHQDRDLPSLEAGHKDLCLLPPNQGDCYAYMPRFFYNSTSGKCEKFIYGGCGGNENNFMTREECYYACIGTALSKPGNCPSRTDPALPRSSKAYCAKDATCPGDQKCCHVGNIKKCVLPDGVHPGYCPRRDDVAAPSKHCSWDSDCAMAEKCCPNEGHKRCTRAIPENPGLCPKRSLPLEFFPCREDCKDDRSCSRGKKCCFVGCGLRCIVPKIYHSVEWVELDQDHALALPVHTDFCQLPSASGTCDAPSVLRVFYNSQAGRCERFPYKGCGGNKNNFATQLECLRNCSNPGICRLPMDQGMGDALRHRYFYNSSSRTCERFFYRGHRGNANNFWEEEDCRQFCGSRAS